MTNVDGLSSGLDTTSIINQLMALERQPVTRLETKQNQERAAKTELTGIRSDVNGLKDLASDLRLPTGWNRVAATSSDEDAVTVTPGSGDFAGQFTFNVTSLATPHAIYSDTTFESLDSPISGGGSVFSPGSAGDFGFGQVTGTGFGDNPVSFEVTQASKPAIIEGGDIPIIPITIDGTNDGVTFEVNGFSYSVVLDHATYDSEAALAAAVQSAIEADPGAAAAAKAALAPPDHISLSTIAEGSDHQMTVLSGTAISALGFSAGAGATGIDAIVTVDGTTTAISDVSEGASVNIFSGSGGQITATLDGPVTVGSTSMQQSGFGGGTLQEVIDAVNSTEGLGYSAAAVNTGSGYLLTLTTTETGADAAIDLDLDLFDGFTGFNTLSVGADAVLTVEGIEPYTVTSSSNQFSELLPGVDIVVNQVTTEPVTITVEPDDEQLADNVSELVDKLNAIIERAAASTKSDPVGGTRSVLQGNSSVRRLESALRDAFASPVEASVLTSAGMIGIELTREGTLSFDRDAFLESTTDNREALTRLFSAPIGDTEAEAGILDRLITTATEATSTGEGYLSTATESADRRIDDYTDQIEAYERRLEIREAALRRTYSNLEVILGGLQQQSGYLASQLNSLGTAS